MADVFVQTDHHIDPDEWRTQHAEGARPDALPYGLDRLEPLGHTIAHRTPLPSGAVPSARVLRRLGHGWDWWGARAIASRHDVEVNLCWDERSGIPTGTFTGSHSPALVTGVIWLTDEHGPSRPVRETAARALARADAVWALSSAQMPVLESTFRVPAQRLHHLRFGVDTTFWSPEHLGPKTPAGLRRVLTVGTDRDRDYDTVLRAVGPLARSGACTLDLVTDRPVEVPAEIGRRHPFLAHVDLRRLYAAVDVVAVALRENLHVSGMTTLLEAQAMGRPVVCNRTPGMEDYVVDGVTGLLVNTGDADAFAAAVSEIVNDPARAYEMGEAGRLFVREHASTSKHAEQLSAILREI